MRNAKRSCPGCGERLPYAAGRCPYCDWTAGDGPSGARVPSARWRTGALLVGFVMLLALGLYSRHRALVAERYAAFAARYLPQPMSALAPAATDDGAFYYCLRHVTRRIEDRSSVEMFPSQESDDVEPLGGGRYRIRSFVEENREDGEVVRRHFSCTVRYDGGRWALEELALDSGRPAHSSMGSP